MQPSMLLASVSFRAQPHKREEILSAVDEMVERMRQAPGCGRCRLLVDTDDPNAFTLESEWQSAAAADAFFESREFQIFKGIRILLRDEPLIVARRDPIADDSSDSRCASRRSSPPASLRPPRVIPSFAMRLRSVLGFMPRMCAAPPRPFDPPPAVLSTFMMCRRSISRSVTDSPIGSRSSDRQPGVAERQRRAAREDHRALDHVLQLAHVARPVVGLQQTHDVGRNVVDALAQRAAEAIDQVADQRRNVAAPLAERRQRDRKHVQAVVEVAAEPAAAHLLGQVAIGRGDDRGRPLRPCAGCRAARPALPAARAAAAAAARAAARRSRRGRPCRGAPARSGRSGWCARR